MSAPTTSKLSPEAAGLLQRKQVEAMLIARSWEDDKFRKRLLADPRGVLAEALGIEIPGSVSVQVQEESPSAMVLSLPARPKASELSDVDLEQVAGGAKGSITGNSQPCAANSSQAVAKAGGMGQLGVGLGMLIGFSWAWAA
jgi:hypothetical protein